MFSDYYPLLLPSRMLPTRQQPADSHYRQNSSAFASRPPPTLAVIPPREDAQPNEQSAWLPPRFRRPVQPPVIRPAGVSLQKIPTTHPSLSHPRPYQPHYSSSTSNHPSYTRDDPLYRSRTDPAHRSPYLEPGCWRSRRSSHVAQQDRFLNPSPDRARRHSAYENSELPNPTAPFFRSDQSSSVQPTPTNEVPVSNHPAWPTRSADSDHHHMTNPHHNIPSPLTGTHHLPPAPDHLPLRPISLPSHGFKRTFQPSNPEPLLPRTVLHSTLETIPASLQTSASQTTTHQSEKPAPIHQEHEDQDGQPPSKRARLKDHRKRSPIPPSHSHRTHQDKHDNDRPLASSSENDSSDHNDPAVIQVSQLVSTPYHEVTARGVVR
ncbi:hypothetical protein PCANC_25387 [Puccinia coronata f. sp. avenae]|uniref:Uncharacterized protein n=1 Tax=Puccinia coronata f. sp. avenae TaxID=200324 RepID=A0A2N5TQY7_9BASI|nr:hypothetical protein PCANC_25387 [Puccinia coronata f. sp. avenae]